MRITRWISFVILCLLSTSTAFAQGQKITEAEYLAARAEASEKIASRERRVVTTERFFDGETLTGTREVKSEYIGKDRERHLTTEKFGRENTARVSIKVGGAVFCKENRKDWTASDEPCDEKKDLPVPSGDYEYSMETDPKIPGSKVYIRKATFPKNRTPENSASGMEYIEIKFWVDENGITGQREYRRGLLESKEWSSIVEIKYELDPKGLRIEAPNN